MYQVEDPVLAQRADLVLKVSLHMVRPFNNIPGSQRFQSSYFIVEVDAANCWHFTCYFNLSLFGPQGIQIYSSAVH
jgi:hypothetical protein